MMAPHLHTPHTNITSILVLTKFSYLLSIAKTKILKSQILKTLAPLRSRVANIKKSIVKRKNKVGPVSPCNYKGSPEILALSDFDRWDDEYLQARRAILSSYHLSDHSNRCGALKKKMKRSMKGMWRDFGEVVRARVGVKVYRFSVGLPWSGGRVLSFRCFLPRLKRVRG